MSKSLTLNSNLHDLTKIIEYDPSQARGRMGDMERGFVPSPLQTILVFDPTRLQVLLKPARNSEEDSPISKMAGIFWEKRTENRAAFALGVLDLNWNFIKSFVSIKTDTAEHMLSLS